MILLVKCLSCYGLWRGLLCRTLAFSLGAFVIQIYVQNYFARSQRHKHINMCSEIFCSFSLLGALRVYLFFIIFSLQADCGDMVIGVIHKSEFFFFDLNCVFVSTALCWVGAYGSNLGKICENCPTLTRKFAKNGGFLRFLW